MKSYSVWVMTIILIGGMMLCAGPGHASTAAPIECFYNGHILTVDPVLSLATATAEHRHKLFVLHAVLVDSVTGKIAATYPQLPSQFTSGPVASSLSEFSDYLKTDERPRAPDVPLEALLNYWQAQGVDERLLTNVNAMDLDGAVVTPGLVDDHFHITSWSKKLPEPGQKFGFWADVGDPAYFVDPDTMERMTTRRSLWKIVVDANTHLKSIESDKLYLHGYLKTVIDDPQGGQPYPDTYMFIKGGNHWESVLNPNYLLNRIGIGETAPVELPPDPNNPATWPDYDYETVPVVMIHTSGQACWYNPLVMEAFNAHQIQDLSMAFFPTDVLSATPPASPDSALWTFTVDPITAFDLLEKEPGFPVDIVTWPHSVTESITIPFKIESIDAHNGTITGTPFFNKLVQEYLLPDVPLNINPFYRPIPELIDETIWNQAAEFYDTTATIDDTSYGCWDPRQPYKTNWYNGAERGLIEFFHDREAGVWRPTGYAEHYVIRDALSYFVLDDPTVEQCIDHRRRMAEWCHRHGITAVNDIMFYRRESNPYEFEAYEALSWDHFYGNTGVPGRRTSLDKTPYNLRVGLYYYVENASDITDIMALTFNDSLNDDTIRLKPDERTHPEWPGWVNWQGWKMQLDGGTGARTLSSNGMIPKARCTDPYEVEDINGNEITFLDHSFGLLTMTNKQEEIFNSRETAALYWLVRESNPDSPFYNLMMHRDWTFLQDGVCGFIERDIPPDDLFHDLNELDNVAWPLSGGDQNQPGDMAAKLIRVRDQITDGYFKTLMTAAGIWYQHSLMKLNDRELPNQHVCHCLGDGAGDLWCKAIQTLRDDLIDFPDDWNELPSYWQAVIPVGTNLAIIETQFSSERYRMEHQLCFSGTTANLIIGENGLNNGLSPSEWNILLSTQPALLACDGQAIRDFVFPYAQELWPLPCDGNDDFWLGVPWRHRSHHHMPCPLWKHLDIPFTLNTDPPSVRDPRPAVTLISSVARTPFEVNPSNWVGAIGIEPHIRPPDYYAGKIYPPLGLTSQTPDNPMALTIEETLCAMTFWGAYASESETEFGALAAPMQNGTSWYADLVVWRSNPLAIKGTNGMTLEQLACQPDGVAQSVRLDVINNALNRFLPKMTCVGGVPVWKAGVRIDMPLHVRSGESFFINAYLDNPGTPLTDVPVFFVLDAYGEFFFWPAWQHFNPDDQSGLDCKILDIGTGTTAVEVLPEFIWPEAGSAAGLFLYGAMLTPDMTGIQGDMDIVEFSYSD